MSLYHAVPACRCRCPAKVFQNARDALDYARRAANALRVGYAVWRVHGGRVRLVRQFRAPRRRIGA